MCLARPIAQAASFPGVAMGKVDLTQEATEDEEAGAVGPGVRPMSRERGYSRYGKEKPGSFGPV